jgi:hypothetical protein
MKQGGMGGRTRVGDGGADKSGCPGGPLVPLVGVSWAVVLGSGRLGLGLPPRAQPPGTTFKATPEVESRRQHMQTAFVQECLKLSDVIEARVKALHAKAGEMVRAECDSLVAALDLGWAGQYWRAAGPLPSTVTAHSLLRGRAEEVEKLVQDLAAKHLPVEGADQVSKGASTPIVGQVENKQASSELSPPR